MTVSPVVDLSAYPHAQRERLAFIDFCLQYFGQVARADLIQHFQTASASSTRDLNLYRELAPDNLLLRHQTKHYHRTRAFKPLFQHNAEAILSSLSRGFGDGISQTITPSRHCFDAIRLVHPRSDIVAALMRAISHNLVVRCRYVSLSSGELERELVPHAIVNNGHRWHVRAFDRRSAEFRDFVCSRFTRIDVSSQVATQQESPGSDHAWNQLITLQLMPHPGLSHPQAIELDYAMQQGQLELEVRAALVGYLMQQWRVDCSTTSSLDFRQYPLALANPEVLAELDSRALLPGASAPGASL